jgi:peptidoglycan lytic transglycosylase
MMLAAGCASRRTPPPKTPAAPTAATAEEGIASWYGGGDGFDGKPTASGELLDGAKLTAAHRQLPFGTLVRVDNLDNGKSVDVRINDRGPFVRGRIIDLSRAAAAAIGMVGSGTARVRVKVLRSGPVTVVVSPSGQWGVQIGAFAARENADRQRDRAIAYGHSVWLEPYDGLTRVKVGPFHDRAAARNALAALESEGFEGIVVPVR